MDISEEIKSFSKETRKIILKTALAAGAKSAFRWCTFNG